jgi:nitrate/nitrite transport system ATP-binding protein
MQDSLMEIQRDLKNTVIMITHDVDEAVLLSDRIVMMTNGPAATVGEILEVDLPRPRHRLQLADDAHYNHLRHEVLRFLYEKQRKVDDFSGGAGSARDSAASTAANTAATTAVVPNDEPTAVLSVDNNSPHGNVIAIDNEERLRQKNCQEKVA